VTVLGICRGHSRRREVQREVRPAVSATCDADKKVATPSAVIKDKSMYGKIFKASRGHVRDRPRGKDREGIRDVKPDGHAEEDSGGVK